MCETVKLDESVVTETYIKLPCPENSFVFIVNGIEMMKICKNGDFLVKGKKIANDIEVYKTFKEFLNDPR